MKSFKFDKIQILFTVLIVIMFLVIGFIAYPPTPGPGKLFTATVVRVEPITFNLDPNGDPRNVMSNGSWIYAKRNLRTYKLYTKSSGIEDIVGSIFQLTYKWDVMRDHQTGMNVQVMLIESGNLFSGLIQDNRPPQ